jgi:SnoaL-like domain
MTESQDARAVALADRQAISDAITGLLDAIDRRDWTAACGHLAEQVRTDYTSLFGGSARTQSAAGLIDGWRSLIPGFDATQHLTGPILADVSGDTARVRCAVTAIHCIGQTHWTPSGHYEMELSRTDSRWMIGAIVFRNVFVAGDDTLPERAQARARRSEEHA